MKRNEKVKMKYMTFDVAGGWKNVWRIFFQLGLFLVDYANVMSRDQGDNSPLHMG